MLKRRTLRVAALQLQAHDRDAFASAWPHICKQVQLAAAGGAQLIVLPEGTVPGYVIGNVPVDSSVTERALNDIQGIAQRAEVVIVYGSVRAQQNRSYNSALVVDSDGSLAGSADKCFLWHFDRQWFAAGQVAAPISTRLGKLGVVICADGRIPTIARSLVDDGAELLVMPTAWVTSGRDAEQFENAQADLLARMRARENGVPFIAANKAGVERGCVAYCGKSQIIDAQGEIVALASQGEAEILDTQIHIGDAAPSRAPEHNPALSSFAGTAHRIAITALPHSIDIERLTILETDLAISACAHDDRSVHQAIASATVDDRQANDPGGLVPFRLAGYQLIIWRSKAGDLDWQRRIARARALELRMYVVCIVEGVLAFAVDPDGVILCGTFPNFDIASFGFDPARTQQTLVAPGTDILEGLQRVRSRQGGENGMHVRS